MELHNEISTRMYVATYVYYLHIIPHYTTFYHILPSFCCNNISWNNGVNNYQRSHNILNTFNYLKQDLKINLQKLHRRQLEFRCVWLCSLLFFIHLYSLKLVSGDWALAIRIYEYSSIHCPVENGKCSPWELICLS